MRDIVIVPCYERPEYSRLCLEYLSRAIGVQDKEIWLHQDQHEGDSDNIMGAMLPVSWYGKRTFKHFEYKWMRCNTTYGNSKNIVDSLTEVYELGAERIFLVEDDIMVASDIFEWHEAVLEEPGVFVSCATALNKSAHFQINGPQAMDESLQDPSAYLKVCGPYSSHCVAFKRENLGRLLEHIAHPSVRWAPGQEQDLYIQDFMRKLRLMHGEILESAWPYVPRAYNVGWRSYHINSGMQFNGTLEEKVAALDATIRNPERLREMSANNSAVTPLPDTWPVRTKPVRNVQKFR